MATRIPVTNSPYQLFDLQPEGAGGILSFFLWWNEHDTSWNLSLSGRDGPIFGMKRIAANQFLMPNRTKFNGGDLVAVGLTDPRDLNSFVANNSLIWYTGTELENENR